MGLLESVNGPEDLRKLKRKELPQLCQEIREFIVSELSSNPGHLGSSLGCVEIAVALHYLYNTPEDKVVWDVGHQAYAHKILTGRRNFFNTNRKMGGISGFPKRDESNYDAFGGGHASVSISAALGMDVASQLKGDNNRCIAVIGDGSMSGGLAFEGLNNAGVQSKNLLVILNDNDISIDPNVGALKDYLMQITASRGYNKLKLTVKKRLRYMPSIRRFFNKTWTALKSSLFQSGNLFEALRFRYFGTVNGNDIEAVLSILEQMQNIEGPKLLHLRTTKGKGYEPAEREQTTWHAPGVFNPETGERINLEDKSSLRYQDVFGHTITELAKENSKIVGITPAMPTGCSLNIMQQELPDRVFDVGIAEGHAVTFSGGLAASGMIPFCNIYSSFMQRGYDNVIHDVVLQGVDVVFCLDRAGLVGEDGVTHHGVYDISFFRCVPNIIIASPLNEHELRNMMYSASQGGMGAYVIRYPRSKGVLKEAWRNIFEHIPVGRSKVLKEGSDIALISLGNIGNKAISAIAKAESELGVSVKHIDLRFVKPIDEDMLHSIAAEFNSIITLEDGALMGGMGSAVLEFLADNGYSGNEVVRLGVPDKLIQHGHVEELISECGYNEQDIYDAILSISKKASK